MMPHPQKKIVELIGETSPYLFENADKITFNDGHTEFPLNQTFESFDRENFSDLMKILTTIGSLNLARKMEKHEKNYFLAEKLRIRKIYHSHPSGLLVAKISPQLENDQKGKSLIEIWDENTKLFQMEIDYFIINEESFKKIFESHYNEESDHNFSGILPETSFEYLNENEFNITVDEFTRNHCKGHFENYQIVPAVLLAKCILRNVFRTASNNSNAETKPVEIDSLEVFLNRAMPVNTIFKVNIKIQHLLKNLKTYKCTVTDHKNEYGHYFVTLKN
ncbi:hypothetical protein [Flavobacterium sp. LHD-85]|uniref:hypothetical protein n=1 Tax=Flavobacterium sp. LHD-85 TaxID=3071410 RepID=UPI0027E1081D|nr:hypothetical protein [Flavobacterium sp. LHD-85]MDQ6531949.1 hypothetical protein [Flavobacterium sp. LHD-85]